MSVDRKAAAIPNRLLLIYIFWTIGVTVVGYFYYENQKTQYLNHEENNLLSITRLKVGQIANWRLERLGDAEVIFNNRIIFKYVRDFMQNPGSDELKDDIAGWMDARRKHYGYREVFLLNARGETVLSVGAGDGVIQPHAKEMAIASIESNKISFTDIHRDGPASEIHLGLIIPVLFHDKRPLGCFLLIIDPNKFLYPLIQTWPVPSETAETLLVRRDGNDVVFLNELRHRKDTALKLKISLSNKELPAAMAVLGRKGIIEGMDYRGQPVFAALDAIPDSPWFIVAKMDKDEVYGPLRRSAFVVSAVIMVLIMASGLAIALWWRQQTVHFYRERYEKEVEYSAEREKANREREKMIEELRRSNEELQQFAYVASHDLQEPLRMVASYTQLLAERYENQLDDKARKFIHYAVDGALRMQLLINDLLTYSRVGTRGKPLEPADGHALLGEAINNLKMKIDETKAVITNDGLPEVRADASQLTQVFQNLIGNAIKFRGTENPRIHISARDDGQAWLFSVKDNGIGIDPQYADKIFIIFQRLHTREEYPGSGIGLAICKKIVERHGGMVWFESELGKGTTFYFTIPK